MKPITLIKYMSFTLLMYSFTSCSKMDATYEEFLKGETIYVGKPDSVVVIPGNNRAQVQWILKGDPKVSAYKVYWNNRADSAVGNIQRSAGVDIIRVIVDKNLREGSNNFEIFTFDKEGNRSVRVEARGNVYGSIFQSEIYNRGMKPLSAWNDNQNNLVIDWLPAINGEVRSRLTYTTQAGLQKTITISPSQLSTLLTDAKPGTDMSFKSYYIPEEVAVDTFAVSNETVIKVPSLDRQLDKALFKEYFITGTTRLPNDAGQLSDPWRLPNLWNGLHLPASGNSYASSSIASSNPINRHFTFDLGVTTVLSRYRAWQLQDRIFRAENAAEWEIWGRTDTPAPDGSYTGWTLLTTSAWIKPSNAAVGTTTPADEAVAAAGQEFIFPANVPPVRYLRVKVLRNYQVQNFIAFGEMTFWGKAD